MKNRENKNVVNVFQDRMERKLYEFIYAVYCSLSLGDCGLRFSIVRLLRMMIPSFFIYLFLSFYDTFGQLEREFVIFF